MLSPVKRLSQQLKKQVRVPGDMVHIDTKHLHLVGSGNRAYHFTGIDALSRFKHAWSYSRITSKASSEYLDELFAYMPFKIKAIVTDNGSEYQGLFDAKLNKLGIQHYFIYPHSPKQNGIVERAIRTDIEEFYEYGNLEMTVSEQNEKLKEWNYFYNYKRYHRSLGCLIPAQFLDKFYSHNPHLSYEP